MTDHSTTNPLLVEPPPTDEDTQPILANSPVTFLSPREAALLELLAKRSVPLTLSITRLPEVVALGSYNLMTYTGRGWIITAAGQRALAAYRKAHEKE